MEQTRQNPFSFGMRKLIKKIAAYTASRYNAGIIGPKRVKHTHIPRLRSTCTICGAGPFDACDAGLYS